MMGCRTKRWPAIVCLLVAAGAARAVDFGGSLSDAIERWQAHRGVALSYLRTGNVDLALAELDAMKEDWRRIEHDFAEARRDDPSLRLALADLADGTAQAERDAEIDPSVARETLARASARLDAWRKGKGLKLPSDCIGELGRTLDRLEIEGHAAPAGTPRFAGLTALANGVAAQLRSCDGDVSASRRQDPEIRRLVDGYLASLAQMDGAVSRGDAGLVQRLISEQRSFQRLLEFRIG